ncbi:helicase-related protein [Pontibacter chinhatensis]|uniref:PLD-like domain-containing protein n=1 Tax=Pontibacter chinhatensis TaxID=1436961 RepID=A0A1I2QSG0_9BACT|nr:helicase-related protein [Pontibacter chinhatensis]SFG28571.1 PLD-like domain-containing protein [Pontibacter chinhatensis]
MILDNENKNPKVHEWITKYTTEGSMSIVTGYFTVGALAYLSKETNAKIDQYKFILGDIVNFDASKDRTLDLLNENISIDASLKLNSLAKEAVKFLKLDKVEAKTLEPNFCHAKVYLHSSKDNDAQKDYYVSGSSNLTEAGIGLKVTNNIELNIGNFGADNQYDQLVEWFNKLWTKPEAHTKKTIIDSEGKKTKTDFKEYLIEQIQKIFIEYTPKQLYYKVLFELFGQDVLAGTDNPEWNKQLGRLENTIIYNSLYEFQQKGVLSLIKMLQNYNGAILADAVGLGKTWSALAVMKFYQLQGREVILLCPKKLHSNWHKYLRHQNSRFERDQLEFFIRYHTDLTEGLMIRYTDRDDKLFNNPKSKPRLFVIDESHNLRNDKSSRYSFLLESILAQNEDAKVLMLSATPINNSLLDIRNQFKLIVSGKSDGFEKSLDIKSIDGTFRAAQAAFNEWTNEPNPRIGDFVKRIHPNFFKLTDSLTVARTRAMVKDQQDGLYFPKKTRPENLFITPKRIGNFETFEELFNHFPDKLSAYQPSRYIKQPEDVDKLFDEQQRDFFLVKMMYILMVKRLESSWCSFQSTVNKILDHHQNALDKINTYQSKKENEEVGNTQFSLFDEEDSLPYEEELTLGKKRKITLAEIDASGNLEEFKKDLKEDIESLELLQNNLTRFERNITKETQSSRNYTSKDDKLAALIKIIDNKRKGKYSSNNSKILIFTVYKDTAFYLYDQLKKRGFDRLAVVSGDASKVSDREGETRNFEPLLERFAPYTKLFREKEWLFQPSDDKLSLGEQYKEWQTWVTKTHPQTWEKVMNPIDILIATDTLSEGQNLQDCDLVVNYDIHWNPVRVIQRMGRIDRLGSPNDKIYGINFWPSDNINSYLNLQIRIEQKMAAMTIAGSEMPKDFTERFQQIAQDEALEEKQKAKMLEQMQISWDEIEVSDKSLGFDNLSLESFRQDLLEEINKTKDYYQSMPKGIYTGFKGAREICPEDGIIALLGYPTKPAKAVDFVYRGYELIYINYEGKPVVLNQREVLDALAKHKELPRLVDKSIDSGEPNSILNLSNALDIWLKKQLIEEELQADGTVKEKMGSAGLDVLDKLKAGKREVILEVKKDGGITQKFTRENFDLITWFVVS